MIHAGDGGFVALCIILLIAFALRDNANREREEQRRKEERNADNP